MSGFRGRHFFFPCLSRAEETNPFTHRTERKPLGFQYLTTGYSGAEADVRVRVRVGVVAVERRETVAGVVVVAAAVERAHRFVPYVEVGFWLTVRNHPPSILPISTTIPDHTSYFFVGRNLRMNDSRR